MLSHAAVELGDEAAGLRTQLAAKTSEAAALQAERRTYMSELYANELKLEAMTADLAAKTSEAAGLQARLNDELFGMNAIRRIQREALLYKMHAKERELEAMTAELADARATIADMTEARRLARADRQRLRGGI